MTDIWIGKVSKVEVKWNVLGYFILEKNSLVEKWFLAINGRSLFENKTLKSVSH